MTRRRTVTFVVVAALLMVAVVAAAFLAFTSQQLQPQGEEDHSVRRRLTLSSSSSLSSSSMTKAEVMQYFTGDLPATYFDKFLEPPTRRNKPADNSVAPTVPIRPGAIPRARHLQSGLNVYAFYVPRPRSMQAKELDMIERWKAAWSAQGYNPIVLEVSEAEQHPEFNQYSQAITSLIANADRHWDPDLRDCYFRYLAMAAQGGGLMVDLDTTPRAHASTYSNTKPDKFTFQCGMANTPDPQQDWLRQVETQNGLPCVAMGSAAEWERVAKVLGWVSGHHDNIKVWTDMQSLMFLERYDDVTMNKIERAKSWRTRGYDKCYFRYV